MLNLTDRKALLPATALLAAAYFLAGKLGLLLAFVHPSATVVWPPTGIALAALLLLGYRVWPGILLGAFLVNLTTAGSVPSSLGIAAGNTLEGLVAARLVNTFANGRHAFERLQDVFRFAVLAAAASTAVSATVGVTSLALTGAARWAEFGPIWLTWWLGDAGGALVVAPLLVLWGTCPPRLGNRRRALEGAAFLLAVVLIGLGVLAGLHPFSVKDYPFEFLTFPVLVWAAFRFGPREAATGTFLLSGIAVWGTLRGFGPFVGERLNESLLLLQAFLSAASVTSLGLAAAVLERQRADEREQAARAAAELAQRDLAFLAEAGEHLAASLEVDATLASVARLAVPRVADWCGVHLMERDGSLRLLTVAHVDPAKTELARELQRRYPPDPDWPRGIYHVLRTGRSELLPDVSDALLVAAARDAEHLALLHAVNMRSVMIVPLVARERTLGAITFVGGESGLRYGAADLALAEELARRAALALERAGLYKAALSARAEAEAALALRDEFLSVAAHELKTPMTGLQLAVQLLLRRLDRGAPPEPAQLRRALGAVDKQIAKASLLVVQQLETSRLEAGRLALDRRVENLSELAACVVEQARGRTSRHELRLAAPAEVRASVDALRLEQVLTNLLDNAIKFSPDGGRIEVELSAPHDGAVRLAVRDHGLGIPPEHRDRIFERFHQAHASDHRSGLGLGLYISRGIVEQHGGRIAAEFPPDGGTRFVVTLPPGLEAAPTRPELAAVA